MDQDTILTIAASLAFTGILFFFVIRASKNKPLTTLSAIAEDKKNPGVYHIFGAVTYMPDDSPSFEKYRHYLLNTADLKVIRGLEQQGSDFDIKSPFAARCVEHMKTLSGRDLQIKFEKEESDWDEDDDESGNPKANTKIKIVEHDANESDTSIPETVTGNVIDVYDTSFGERNSFALKITLNGISFAVPKVKGTSGISNVIWRKNEGKLFIFYSRFVMMKFGVGMLVLDTNTGNVISDGYFKNN
jgi:hypothetical protein